MDGKINGKAKKNWQAKKHFGWLGPMHSTHPVWFDCGSCFLLRKEEFERIRNEKRTILDETLEKEKDSSRSNSKLCKMFFEKGFFGNSKAFHGMDQVMDWRSLCLQFVENCIQVVYWSG